MVLNRCWRFHEIGGPEVLRLEALPMPEPGPHEVRVKLRAVSLNRADLLWISAAFFKPELPARVGYEICGIVDRIGDSVTAFKPGERVSNLPTTHIARYASFADYAVLPASALVHTPGNLHDVEGASFLFTHLTQMCGLVELAALKPGHTVLVTAAASANGLSAILIARHLGAKIIATTRTVAKRELLLATGAHHVICTNDEPLSERVAQATDGRGVDLIYDCVGGGLTSELVRSAAANALWIMYGFLDHQPVKVHWVEWFARQIRLQTYSLMQFTGLPELGLPGRPAESRRAIETVMTLCGSGELVVPISKVFHGIESIPDAFSEMTANLGGGKIAVGF